MSALCVSVDLRLRLHLADSFNLIAGILGFLASRVIHPGLDRDTIWDLEDITGHLPSFLARPGEPLASCDQLIVGALQLFLDVLLRLAVLDHRIGCADSIAGDAVQHLLISAALFGGDIEGLAILLDGLIDGVNGFLELAHGFALRQVCKSEFHQPVEHIAEVSGSITSCVAYAADRTSSGIGRNLDFTHSQSGEGGVVSDHTGIRCHFSQVVAERGELLEDVLRQHIGRLLGNGLEASYRLVKRAAVCQ